MVHGYFIQMGGFMLDDGNNPIGVLGPRKLADLLDNQKVAVPEIAEKGIQDRSKSDGLSKGLVIIQTTWFIAQCVARRVQGLIITELELLTLAFAALNIFMYACWWNKPLDVQTTVPVYLLDPSPLQVTNQEGSFGDETICHRSSSSDRGNKTSNIQGGIKVEPETIAAVSPFRPVNWHNLRDVTRKVWWIISGMLIRWPASGVVNVLVRIEEILASNTIVSGEMFVSRFYAHDPHLGRVVWEDFSIPFVGILFGAIHCAGWNYAFPSPIESDIWRISSAVITGVPAVGILFVLGVLLNDCFPVNPLVSRTVNAVGLLTIVMLPFYVVARVALLVEALISLRDLSPEALKELEWTTFIPHV
ncbi:hypothetical protein GALMADRAFT_251890 [Galerina marginata CBS 339.88]|uniref:Uncharacterized protein n=1 Tax=Galerina marginata (strain CBS 339.88) TaxID=685588 RepID=A0A067T2N4_GALM3|nr:hypothetical protein GALMADRAFT_251890 [Galerina marginata CBS 339.88]